jgi:uncharacterized protein
MSGHCMQGRFFGMAVVGIALLCFAASPVCAQQTPSFRKFEAADRAAAYEACPLLRRLDEWWFSNGRGPDEPDPVDLARCESAAAAGDVRAQMAMIDHLNYRFDLPGAKTQAYRWALAASDAGFAPALMMLAIHQLFEGPDEVRNDRQGFDNLRKAMDVGYAPAGHILALSLLEAKNVEADPGEALRILAHAADLGWVLAAVELGDRFGSGRGLAQDWVAAAKWYRRAAELGDLRAQVTLAGFAFVGAGMPSSYGEAIYWYKKAADRGNAEAQFRLAGIHRFGYGVPKNSRQALRFYRLAAAKGHSDAINNLGVAYEFGYGVRKNRSEAVRLYRIAAERGLDAAQSNLAAMYRKGLGVQRDDRAAFHWYREAAGQNFATAQFELARMFELGRGGRRYPAEALRLYALAALQKDAGGIAALERLGVDPERWPELAQRRSDFDLCDFAIGGEIDARERIAVCGRVIASGYLDDSGLGVAHTIRGITNRQIGDLEAAIQDLGDATRLLRMVDGRNAQVLSIALSERGGALASDGRHELAVRVYDALLSLKPDQHAILNGRCYSLAVLGRLDTALADCERALGAEPKNPAYLDSRGYTYLRLGRLAEALRDYDAAIKEFPGDALTWFGRSIVRMRMGDAVGARLDLAQARSIEADIDTKAALVFLTAP